MVDREGSDAGDRPPNPLRDRRVWVVGAAILAAVALAVPIILALTGGSNDGSEVGSGSTSSTTSSPGRSRTTTTTSLPAENVDRNPLTGETLATATSARVIAVKVDNAPAAQPQIGLGDAEMVFEAPVEGGMTRFSALFFDRAPQLVGPVRSVRTYDADVLAPFLPTLISTGGQDFVVRELRAAGVELREPASNPELFQSLERPVPYDQFASVSLAAEQRGGAPAIRPFAFSGADDLDGGFPAEAVEIPFSGVVDVRWVFDGSRWVREENDAAAQVYASYEGDLVRLSFDTVVVLSVAERSAGYTDSAGATVPTFDVIGFGAAIVAHGGRVVEGEWRRAAQEDGFLLYDEAGVPLELPTGTVFVELVPRYVPVAIS